MLITPKIFKEKIINQDFLESLINNNIEENEQLDYKAELSFNNAEIAKDISSFANTEGGNIIYGIEEVKNKPEKIIPIKDKDLREKVDQIAHTGINPPLNVKIWPIDVKVDEEKGQVFILYIPKKYPILHYAKKYKRFYKRTNFTSTPMEKYEIDLAYKLNLELKEKLETTINNVEKRFIKEVGASQYKFIYTVYPIQYGERLFKFNKKMNQFLIKEFPKTPLFNTNLFMKKSYYDQPQFRQEGYVFKSELGYHNADCLIRIDGIIIYVLHFKIMKDRDLIPFLERNSSYNDKFVRLKGGIVMLNDRIFEGEFFIDYLLGLLEFLAKFFMKVEYFDDINITLKIEGAFHEWTETGTNKKFQYTKIDPIEKICNIEMIPEIELEIIKNFFNPIFNGFGIMDSELDWLYTNLEYKLKKKNNRYMV